MVLDELEEGRELTEDERPVSFRMQLAKLLGEGLDLGRYAVTRLVGIDQPRIEAELAQSGERGEDRDPVADGIVEQPEDALTFALEVLVIDPPVDR